MKAVLKLFGQEAKEKKKNGNHYLDIGEIGMPTQVCHNFSGKINPDGSIGGIPESWKQRLKLMITSEEAENPENTEKAAVLCRWIDTRARDGQSDEFMRVNSSSPNNSVVSSSTLSEDMSCSGDRGSAEDDSILEEAGDDAPAAGIDNKVLNAAEEAVCDNEAPTLRRQKKERSTRQGPRVTRNLTEDVILGHLRDATILASPWEHYTRVRALCVCLARIQCPCIRMSSLDWLTVSCRR